MLGVRYPAHRGRCRTPCVFCICLKVFCFGEMLICKQKGVVILMAYIHTMDNACRVLLIMNPNSGMFQSRTNMYDLVSIFTKNGCISTTLMTTKAGDAAKYVEEHADRHDIVVFCGGDGTLNEIITGMMHIDRRIPIGFIPCGTTNDMARTLKLPIRSVKRAAKEIVLGDNVHQDVGMFGADRYFTYIASFGAFTKVSYATPRWKKHAFGHMAYLMDGILALNDIHPWKMKIACDQFEAEESYAFGCIANSTSIAGVIKLDEEKVSLNDGKFEVLLIRHPKTPADLQKILDVLVNRRFNESAQDAAPMVRFFHTDHITVTPEKEMPWTLDGEYGGIPESVDIRCLHGAVEILRRL